MEATSEPCKNAQMEIPTFFVGTIHLWIFVYFRSSKKLLMGKSPLGISNCFFFRWLPSGYLNVTEGELLEVRFASRCLVSSDGGLMVMILTISV